MKKPLTSRIIGLASLYCVLFCLLVILQFSNMGSFSILEGGMSIRGSYLEKQQPEQETQDIAGGVKIFYGGLDFSLKEERGKGLMLTNANGTNTPVNPQKMSVTGNSVNFILPEGTKISFSSVNSASGQELHINADFAENISRITIPVVPRRASLVRDAGQLGIMYGGMRFTFSSLGQELENGYLTLSRDSTFISYRSRGKQQKTFNPSDYIIAQINNYDSLLRSWQTENYNHWNQSAMSLQYEDDIIAYSAQALLRGNYATAIESISADFANSSKQSYRSSVFVGGSTNAHNSISAYESEKNSLINRLVREKSINILKEEHLLDFLFTRNNLVLANEVINIINNASPDMLVSDHCPGLLEVYFDLNKWRTDTKNPIEHLTEQMLLLISQNLNRDTEKGTVYASSQESNNSEYSMRLGKALVYWAEATQNTEWAEIGRSLILSAIANGNAGRLHNILNPTDYYPRASLLTNEGIWTWTVSPSVRAYYAEGNLNISASFPLNMAHFMIIRGVRPFLRIQIHGMEWRSDSQFERYDSSGWIYYPEDQTLIVKLKHRSTVESVRLIYRITEVIEESEAGAVIE
jgi:hypothetical protein